MFKRWLLANNQIQPVGLQRSPLRTGVARTILFLAMFLPGLMLAINTNFWTTTHILYITLHFPPLLVAVLGCLAMIIAACAVKENWRDLSYGISACFYLLITLAYLIAIFQGISVGIPALLLPLIVWIYAESAINATQRHGEVAVTSNKITKG